jgi:hypothetical protein
MSEKAREASKSKAERLVRADPNMRVDASGYKPDGALNGDVAAGMRPVSRRAYRRGGKIAGESTASRADRRPRASGGALTANSLVNRNVKDANEERDGIKFRGGLKTGGRAKRDMGGLALPQWSAPVARARGGAAINDGTRPVSGRMARKGGGRTKGKTNVNIIITQPGGMDGPPAAPPMGAAPPAGPIGLRQGVPPPAPAMGAGAPPPAMPMARKDGGRAGFSGKFEKAGKYPIESGGGGALGRLEKAKAYGA